MSKRRPSAAMIVAVIALVLGLGGAAIAADLTKPQVKKIAKKVANKQIKKKASGLSVANAVNATNAANSAAVGGQNATHFFVKIPAETGTTNVLQINGLTVTTSCTGGSLTLDATTSVGDSYIASNFADNGSEGSFRTSEFDVGDTVDLLGGLSRGEGSFTYSAADGKYVQVQLGSDDAATFGAFDGCFVIGNAFSN